jgi:16S rRNA G1207 methylase RsmC
MANLLDVLPPCRPAEAHALKVAAELPGNRIACATVGRAQAAVALADSRPEAAVTAWLLDRYHTEVIAAAGELPPGLALVCAADLPSGHEPYDLAVFPCSKSGEAELSRDILQQMFRGLAIGGQLVAAIDHPADRWLREQLAATGETVRVRPATEPKPQTICYVVEKTRDVKKIRDFSCEIVFRDRERLLTAFTRPGVFAHRRIDPAARHLLNAVDLAPDTRVVEIGCGSGCASLGLAARDPSVHVHALDASARAVECTRRGAEHNQLSNLTVALEAGGTVPNPGTYDLALANPPYYSDYRIAELFVDAARRALAPGGTMLIITKQPSWYEEHLPDCWNDVAREVVKGYHIFEAVR